LANAAVALEFLPISEAISLDLRLVPDIRRLCGDAAYVAPGRSMPAT
jgi:hypothetical protein